MKLFVIIFLSTACTTSSQQVPGSIKFLEEDAKVRRQGVSYSTSVIHQNPNHPDQRAESSIKVDFNTQKAKPTRQPSTPPQYQSYQQKRPKALQSYSHNLVHHPQANNLNIQTVPFNGPQTQSFNVGYSVSFTGNPKPPAQSPRAFSRQKLENAEIITGSRKDVVQKPSQEFDSNEFVTNALIDLKKQKVSGIKPKFHKFPSNKENDAKNFIGNLAPKTQQFLSYLGDAKPISSSNPRFRQQLQSNEAQSTQNVATTWTNLSPSVEIYHSKELPQNHNFSPREQIQQSKQFDHIGALGKSQGFDYTNALGEVEKNEKELAGNSLGTQTVFQSFPELHANLDGNPLIVPFTNNFGALPIPVQVQENLQISHKSEGSGIQAQYPGVDMSLLREASNVKNLPNDLHTITIPFDTSLLQAMQQKLLTSTQPIQSFDGKGQVQLVQGNVGQQFQTQEENVQNPFQDFQTQQIQPTQQYNVYETPQHALFLKKGFDQYFDQYYDQVQPQESKHESVTARYPKVNNNNNNRLRSTKGIEIHTSLQPPPMQFTRHRRMFMG